MNGFLLTDAASLTAGILLGLAAGFSPGPLLMLVISQSLRHGFREGAKVALSPLLTDVPIILLSLFLLSRVAGYRPLLGVLSLGGAFIVISLARDSFGNSGIPDAAGTASPRSLRTGALVNTLSPHPWLFWATVGGPQILKGWEISPAAGLSFIVGFLGCLTGAKVVVAAVTARSRHALAGSAFLWSMRALALLLVGYAMVLVRDGLGLLGLIPH